MRNLISEGTLTVAGKDSSGNEIIVEAPIKELDVTVENDLIYVPSFYGSDRLYSNGSEITLSAKVTTGGTYTIKATPAPKGVERTARVEVLFIPEAEKMRQPTLAEVRKAAEKAGVGEDTPFTLYPEDDYKRNGRVTWVVFKWTD